VLASLCVVCVWICIYLRVYTCVSGCLPEYSRLCRHVHMYLCLWSCSTCSCAHLCFSPVSWYFGVARTVGPFVPTFRPYSRHSHFKRHSPTHPRISHPCLPAHLPQIPPTEPGLKDGSRFHFSQNHLLAFEVEESWQCPLLPSIALINLRR
jgi:hypothetical protein